MHICNMRAKIDFEKVNTIDDIKIILEELQVNWPENNVPDKIKHLVTKYDANVVILNL